MDSRVSISGDIAGFLQNCRQSKEDGIYVWEASSQVAGGTTRTDSKISAE